VLLHETYGDTDDGPNIAPAYETDETHLTVCLTAQYDVHYTTQLVRRTSATCGAKAVEYLHKRGIQPDLTGCRQQVSLVV